MPPQGTGMKIVDWRPATPQDRDFLLRVYAGTRAEELARTGWDETTCASFLTMQFEAQDRHYRAHFPDAECSVIGFPMRVEPASVGRLWVDRRERSIHVLDIALLPEFRGQGLGTACLRRLMVEAAGRQAALTIKVECFNPARRWYERLGFVAHGEHGMHVQMRWSATGNINTPETEHEQA